jgi:L-iditol 2-dehydrogenase
MNTVVEEGVRVAGGSMLAAVWHGADVIKLERQPLPVPQSGQVLVRILACGLCATDLHMLDGQFPLAVPPRVVGHEMVGEIAALGPGVTKRRLGEVVALQGVSNCGRCQLCYEGRVHECPNRVGFGGGWAEYTVLPEYLAYCLPDGVPPHIGAVAEPLAAVVYAIRTARIQAGDTVAVVGAGAIGLLTMQLARHSGASRTLVSDPEPSRRALAERLGATTTVDPRAVNLADFVRDWTDGIGVDVAFEAAGTIHTIKETLALPRPGGTVVLVGGAPAGAELTVQPYDLWLRSISIHYTYAHTASDFRRAVELLPTLDIEPMLTHRFPLSEVHAAIATARRREGLKVLVVPESR